MHYQGSCHCGQIAFEVEGELRDVMDCNCSICQRKGALHWFVPRDQLRLTTPAAAMQTYTFGAGTIHNHFCPRCGLHPFAESSDSSGTKTAAVNVRCLDNVDLTALNVQHFDGRAL